MIYFAGIQLTLFAPTPVAPTQRRECATATRYADEQIRAAVALADWHGPPAPEPQRKLTVEERCANDADVALFHHELRRYRERHPEARPGAVRDNLNPEEGATSGDERIARTGVGATGPGPSSGGTTWLIVSC